MAQEIERKFLLGELPEWLEGRVGTRIEQGYLALDGEVEVRLRRRGEERLLTVKGGSGEVRQEIELALGAEEFESLWPLTGSRRLRKTRRLVSVGNGLEAEVDVYEDGLAGLVIAEVEFGSERESREFTPPGWLGREVTGDGRYANQCLASEGAPASGAGENGRGRAAAYRFRRGERVDDGIRRVAAGRLDKAIAELAAVRSGDGDLAEAIHSARKEMKKLRALLRLVREPLGKESFKAENHRYRDAARLLSQSRDAEVKLETLAALRERFGLAVPAEPARAWSAALEAERDEVAGQSGGEAGERIERVIALLEAGREEAGWPLDGDSWKLIGPGLRRGYRQGRRELKLTRRDPSAESIHRWRKRVKDLWYQLRLVRGAWPQLLDETVDRAHELADLLGDHHDLAVLAEDLGDRRDLGRRDELAALIARRQGELLETALALGARLFAEKPGAFGARIEAYWGAWRR